jgi:isopentenyl phosphate kinase
MNKSVTLIKLGGAVITNKEIPNSVRTEALNRLVEEIARAKSETSRVFVVGNGVGSFAHVPAHRYKTIDGFIHEESRIGMAITQDSAARINREVVKTMLEHNLPALTVAPSSSLVTRDRKAESYFPDVLEEYLKDDMIPVVHGDVIADRSQGCTIWSTDRIFTFFAKEFTKREWIVEEIIHVTEASGVWKDKRIEDGKEPEVYREITPSMKEQVRGSMVDIKGFDVTGGMWHKIEESLELTKIGIRTRILSGLIPDTLYKTLLGDQSFGTLIHSNDPV